MGIIKIKFTEELLKEWTQVYFKEHPKAKNNPIKYPSHPSINEWCILKRQAMNSLKQKWKEFTIFVVKYYGLENLCIKRCKCEYIVYQPTKKVRDLDNISPKFILDGLTDCGLIKSDDYTCITKLVLSCEYRKGERGAELILYDCEY